MIAALIATLAVPAPLVRAQDEDTQTSWSVYAERVYDPEGGTIENGLVTISDGKIVSVTPGANPPGDALRAAAITPGLVDASARITAGFHSVEQSNEVTPQVRVADSLNVFNVAWARQARQGVTTVGICAPDYNVVGGVGSALKTAGPSSIADRIVKRDAVLRGAIGTRPSQRNHPAFGRPTDFYSRRPTTRMGVEWEWRKAMYEAAASKQDPERAFPGSEELVAVLDGELTLFVQAWATQDIRTAVFLKEECEREGLGSPRLVIDAGAEAWREPDLLVRSGTPVVLPPFPPNGRTTDNAFMAWNVARQLRDAGVTVALSAHGGAWEDQLGIQAGFAMRGGLTLEEALEAVTIVPARILGVDDRVGSLAAGKDADLVLWSGTPFEPSSGVVGVLIDGALVVDPRPDENQ